MIFWLTVLVGGLFAWIAVRIGFYATWIMLFNLVLSAYMAVFLTPVVIADVPAATATLYGYALTFVSIAVATLLIAYAICFACVSGRLSVEFPKAVDTMVAGLLGFQAGFLVWSLVTLALYLTPLTQLDTVKALGFDAGAPKTSTSYVCWWCNMLHSLVSSSGTQVTGEQAVSTLLARARAAAASEPKPSVPAESAGAAPPPPPPAAAPPATNEAPARMKEGPREAKTGEREIDRQIAPVTQQRKGDFAAAPPRGPGESMKAEPSSPRPRATDPTGEQKPAQAIPPKGPLAGTWMSSTGAQLRIDDDGQTITIDLISSGTVRVLTGKLQRQGQASNAISLAGNLEGVFAMREGKRYTIDVTATIADADHLHLKCANWPKWSNKGKFVGKVVLEETLTRSSGVPLLMPMPPANPVGGAMRR